MHDDEQAIRQLVSTWISASKAGDHEKVLSLMADDVVFLVAGQPAMRGKAAFAAAQLGMKGGQFEATSKIEEVKVLGEWAYVWTHLTVTFTPPAALGSGKSGAGGANTAIRRAGYTLSILQKQNGRWVMFRDANMLATTTR